MEELADLKALLILGIVKPNAKQGDVGKALGVGNTQISNIIIGANKKKRKKKGAGDTDGS